MDLKELLEKYKILQELDSDTEDIEFQIKNEILNKNPYITIECKYKRTLSAEEYFNEGIDFDFDYLIDCLSKGDNISNILSQAVKDNLDSYVSWDDIEITTYNQDGKMIDYWQ